MLFAISLAVVVGIAISCQSPTNGSLGLAVGTIQASYTNFAVGLIICIIAVAITGKGDISLALQAPPWQLIGGVYGVVILTATVISTPRLGVTLTMTMLMLGQLVGGMVTDQFGLAGSAVTPVTPLRLVGAAVAALGIWCVFRGTGTGKLPSKKQAIYLLLPFFGAAIASLQPSTNATLGASIGTIEASCVNFIGGTLILLVLVLITGKGRFKPYTGVKPWQFTGGCYGAFGVLCMIIGSPLLGIGLWNVCTMLGQLAGGMVVDALGLFQMKKRPINKWRAAGAGFMFCGIVIITASKML